MKASVFVGISVDGFIARPNGAFDFLPSDGGEPHGYEEFFASVDALVIGRSTFDVVLSFPKWYYGAKPVFVLSNRPLPPVPPEAVVEHRSGDPATLVKELEGRGIGHIYVDGGSVIQQCLRAGLIDQLIMTRVPVLIGEGISLFGATGRDIPLRHVATQTFAGGLVRSEYEVVQ